ncbi:MAG: hypothetical protein H6R07_282 [Proteobacteria bacterium]|nr:hypothetical protein [Pseudomonadota bacterium]
MPEAPRTYAAAGWWRRFLSFWYEVLLLAAIVLLLQAAGQFLFQLVSGLPVTALTDLPGPRALNSVWLLVGVFAWFALCWRRGGRTLAMKAWRMRLIMANGGRLTWLAILIRFVIAGLCYGPALPLWVLAFHDRQWLFPAWLASGWLLAPFVWAWFDRDGQLLHDRLAGTRLVITQRRQQKNQAAQQN